VDALVAPHPLTIARVALLSRVNSPVLFGHADDLSRNLEALYLSDAPFADAARSVKAGTAQDDALAWADADEGMREPGGYAKRMVALLDAITAFWKMLPNGDPQKKTPSATETAGSQSLSNGPAAPTDGGLNT
jgi:hypothetical protein